MRRKRVHDVLVLACVLVLSHAAIGSSQTLPLSELVPGQRAVAKTVLRGTAIETFELEIVSVIHKIGPNRDLILAKAVGEEIARLGVAQGMSGSPVYVDGLLIGALSSTWSFSKEPYFGITPVEQMAREAAFSFDAARRAEMSAPSMDREGERSTSRERFSPIGAPLVLSGFDSRIVELAEEYFEPFGLTVTEGGAAGESQRGGAIEPGATVGIRLAGGDVNMTAIGTVTWVDGDRVHAWGHPFFGMGDIEMPLVGGYIHAVVPSRMISFKLGSGAEVVGTAVSDRGSGIYGRLGDAPPATVVDLRVTQGGETQEYHFELVRSPTLVWRLVGLTAANAFLVRGGTSEPETIRFRSRIVLTDGRETTIETVLASDQAISQTSSLLAEAARVIVQNPFEEVEIERIESEMTFESGVRAGRLTEVTLENQNVKPGATLLGSYTVVDYRGTETRHEFSVPVPENARPGRYLLLVSDATTAERYEAERDPRSFAPRSLDEYLARLSRLRRTDEVHVHLYRSSRGVLIDGRPLPDLPPSALAVMGSAQRSGVDDSLPAELVSAQQMSAGKVIQGGHTILFEIEKEHR